MLKPITRIFTLFAVAALAAPATATADDGVIDLGHSIEEKITTLEQLARGSMDAHYRVTFLRWLAELYESTGDYNAVEDCYQRMLRVAPYDVSIHNSYGRFLMTTRKHYARADRILHDAHLWGTSAEPHAPALADTYEIWALDLYLMEAYDRALGAARMGIEFSGDRVSTATLRTMAATLVALERYDEAAETYLRVIGREGGVNHEDINSLQLFIERTSRYSDDSVRELVAAAVESGKRERIERVEAEGGMVVSLVTSDDVTLEGTLRQGDDNGGAVLFVPEPGSSRDTYTLVAQMLFVDDFASLAIDLRGHGGSRSDSLPSPESIAPDGYVHDIAAGIDYLRQTLGVSTDRIAIIAPGAACPIVEKTLYENGVSPSVAYLSPLFVQNDRDLENAVAFHADRPALIVYSDEDMSAMESSRWFGKVKPRDNLVVIRLREAGRGITMLRHDDGAMEGLQAWLRGALR